MAVRSATAWTATVCLVSALGCASSRSGTTQAPVAPQTAHATHGAHPQYSSEHLIHIGDTLRLQGRYNHAADVYGWVLKQDPNNLAARQRLAMLPGSPITSPASIPVNVPPNEPTRVSPNIPTKAFPERQTQQPLPPPPATNRQQPRQIPRAPGVIEDVPAFPGQKPAPKTIPGAPGVFDSAMTRYQSSSALPTTVVDGSAGSTRGSSHTIQIIPASKGGVRKTQQLNVSDDEPAQQPGPFRAPVPTTGDPSAAKQSTGVRATTATATPTLPPALKELGRYVDHPGKHVAAIAARLHDGSADVRALAAFLLGRAGDDARVTLPALEAGLNSEPNGPTRIRVAEAIVRISPQHPVALQTLLAGLSASNRAVRWEAVCVSDVVPAGPHRAPALAKVIDRLQDVEVRIQVMAALKLGNAKAEKAAAVAALEKVLKNTASSGELKKAATISLAALHSGRPAPAGLK